MSSEDALSVRDSIVSMIKGLLDRERPKPRVCEVYSYNRGTRLAEVLLPGETTPGIQARFPMHLQPTASKMDDGVGNATGNLVLVEGGQNNYRITQIIEGNAFVQASPTRSFDYLVGGGTVTWDDRYLKWSADFVSFVGMDQIITDALFNITMPALGDLVTCHGVNGFDTVAVAAGGIDMQPDGAIAYSALYYAPDLEVASGDVGSFHLVGAVTAFMIPPMWILIAIMDQVSDYIYVNTGTKYPLPTLPQPVSVYSTADEGPGAAGTAYVFGSTRVGLVFTAPASGAVYVNLRGRFKQNVATNLAMMAYAIRAGNTIGSGTSFFASQDDFALIAGAGITAGGNAHSGSGMRKLHTGLTPGSQYNVQVEYKSVTEDATAGGGTITVLARELLVEPVLI